MLALGHSFRESSPLFGSAELRPPPLPRTHDQFVADGLANVRHRGYKKDDPYKKTGVKEVSPLRFLPLFDLSRDVMPDMMHIPPVIWKGHIVPMFRYPLAMKCSCSCSLYDRVCVCVCTYQLQSY